MHRDRGFCVATRRPLRTSRRPFWDILWGAALERLEVSGPSWGVWVFVDDDGDDDDDKDDDEDDDRGDDDDDDGRRTMDDGRR